MTGFEVYSLILSIIVFIMLVSLFSYLVTVLIKLTLKHIKAGLEDENIIKEFNSETKTQSKFSKVMNSVLNISLCIIFGAFFISSLYINFTQDVYFDNVPTYRVVLTSSMENKNSKNTYLFSNNLNNQISAFDLIATYKIPDEYDLKLYDIVLYEVDDILVVHRIVGIEEPNAYHSERHFLLQGDAVGSPDRFPVLYSQMKGIYRNEKIPYIGSFIVFMQSPAGWLCLLLVIVAIFLVPILEKKLLDERKTRYSLLTQPVQNATTGQVIVNDDDTVATCNDTDDTTADDDCVNSRFDRLNKTIRTFMQRLALASPEMQRRYDAIVKTLEQIDGVRLIEGKKQHSYKCKTHAVARLFFRGKTLNICLGLSPAEYENSKYIFTDFSQSSAHKNYPMRIKLTSERQTRWARELIIDLAKKRNLKIK